jgi:hypothetical protein
VLTIAAGAVPRHIRQAYGDEMRDAFEASCRAAAARGPASYLAAVAPDVCDRVVAGAREFVGCD